MHVNQNVFYLLLALEIYTQVKIRIFVKLTSCVGQAAGKMFGFKTAANRTVSLVVFNLIAVMPPSLTKRLLKQQVVRLGHWFQYCHETLEIRSFNFLTSFFHFFFNVTFHVQNQMLKIFP